MISGADEDGRVMVEFSEPVGGRRVKMLTPDEINGMLYKEETSESPANAEEAMAEETEPPTAGQEESGESALERIPKDAQTGEPQYTQTDAPTAWDAIVEQTEGDEDMARSVVDSTVRDKEAALKKLESSNPKPGATVAEKIAAAKEHKAAIEAARQELEQWKAIAEVENSRKAEAEAKAKAEEEEAKAKAKAEEERRKKFSANMGSRYSLSDEYADNGEAFVKNEKGGTNLIEIPHEIFDRLGISPLPFKLTESMALHVYSHHAKELKLKTLDDAIDFVLSTIGNADHVRLGRDNSYVFSVENGKDRVGKRAITIVIGDNAGEFIGIRTSGYESIKKLKERPLLWERSAKAASEDVATPTITTIESLNGDETLSRTKSQSNGSSASKVSESSETKQEKAEKSISAKVKEASADVNTEPTEAQKEAGNYKKGHVQVGAFDITIEQPEGSIRRGTDADGKQWESKMHNTYGYFRGTEGVDGDHIDVFLSNDMDGWNGAQVFVVDQYNPDGTFDEHKVMLGFNDASDAKNNYLSNYEKGWENGRRIDVSAVNLEDFEKWIASSHRKTKPFSEYKSVKPADDSETFKGHKAENSGRDTEAQIKHLEEIKDYPGADKKIVQSEIDRLKAKEEAKAKSKSEEVKSKSEEAKSKYKEKNGVDDAKIEAVSEALSKGDEKAEQLVQGLTSRELSKLRSKVKASPVLENEWQHRVRTRGDVSLHDWMLENQYVEPVKRVSGTFKMTDYIAPKDSPYAERIGGVYHDKSGFAVATDGRILVADKGSYDPKLKGKIIGKDGVAMENKFPDWQEAISTAKETKSSLIDVEGLHRFVAGVLRANKRAYISLRFPDGTVGVFKANRLNLTLRAMKQLGTSELLYTKDGMILVAKSEKGTAMLMGLVSVEDELVEANGYAYPGNTVSYHRGEVVSETPQEKNEKSAEDSQNKIIDVGEKISGARKDLLHDFSNKLKDTTLESLITLPFSKAFKRPDLKTAVEQGLLRQRDARFAEAVMATYLSKNKPRLLSGWKKGESQKNLEAWAKDAYFGVQTLRALFEADETTRDKLIDEILSAKAYREDDIDRRKKQLEEWNPGKKFEGKCYPLNPVAVYMAVYERLGYDNIGEFKLPVSGVGSSTFFDHYELTDNSGKKIYPTRALQSFEDVVDEITYLSKVKNADEDTDHPNSIFRLAGINPVWESTGWRVLTLGTSSSKRPETHLFKTKEEAEKFAEEYKAGGKYRQASIPIENKELIGYGNYELKFHLGEKDISTGLTFSSKEDALAAIDTEHEKLNAIVNEKLAKARESGSKNEKRPQKDYVRIQAYTEDGKAWKYAVVLDERYAPKSTAFNTLPYSLANGFSTRKEAVAYIEKHRVEWDAKIDDINRRRKDFVFLNGSSERVGEDYRKGEDITAEQFREQFGFRGVQFGNWTNQKDRQAALNNAFDSFMDLAKILGISPRAVSLNGELGIAFGARGGGGAKAHYEREEVVINLTKTMGAGSLAHEWWHALDNYFARRGNVKLGMVTEGKGIAMRGELRKAYDKLVSDTENSDYHRRSRDAGASYWGTRREETARMFAMWVFDEISKKGERNSFLTDNDPAAEERYAKGNYDFYVLMCGQDRPPMTFEEFRKSPSALAGYVYPSQQELEEFGADLRKIFDTVQERVDEETGNTVLYHRGEVVSEMSQEERVLRDAVIDRLRESGMEVITDEEAGQRVLDEANGKAKLSAKKRRALETASLGKTPRSLTVVSSADGAKVLKSIDTLVSEFEKSAVQPKTFIGDVAKALGAKRGGSASEYTSFETKNGKIITIRLSNHNAKVSNFDANGETDGISIVVSPKKSEGMTNDGKAHVVEYYYDAIKLRRAEGKPLADIVRSIKQALYSGEFEDTTGLAERQEVNAEITDRVRFFRTAKGEAYGFTVGGKIYIDPKIANTETPIHEYAHLWAAALRGQNPKEWRNIVELMKGTSVWDEVKKRYPELNTDDDIADEVLATYSGRRGAERLREEQRKIAGDEGGVFEKAEAISALERVKQALRKFWKSVADFLHIHYKSAEEVADRVMKDLLDGVDPRKHFNSRNDDPRFMFAGEKGAARADRGEEALPRQNNLGVAQKMEAAKKEAKAIKLATGWERGADGKWRYEIPDGIYYPKGDAELKKALARQPWREELNDLSDRILDGEGLSKEETERFNELAEKEAAFKADYLKKEKPHLADWLENDELFKAYPELKRVGIVFTDNMPKEQAGYYDSKSNTITVNTNSSEDTASIIAHEVQHAIQRYEGFATGGNLKAAMEYLSGNKRADVKIKQQLAYKLSQEKGLGLSEEEVNSLIGHLEYEDISDDELQKQIDALCQKHNITEDQLEDIYPMDSVWHEAYNRISGEAEARNVQKRMGMTAEERRVSLAADTEDVARADQILLFADTGESMSLESPKEDDINAKFNIRLAELVKNPNQKDKVLHLGRSSKFLTDGGLADAEIILEFDKLAHKSKEGYKHEHPFDISDIKDLPKAISSPIAVFDNTNGKNDGRVILTELKKDGRNFIVAVKTSVQNRRGGIVLEVNQITTLFPKDAKGIVYWFNSGKATNIDKEKALRFIEALPNHPGTTIKEEELFSAAKVVKDFVNPKFESENDALFRGGKELRDGRKIEFVRKPTAAYNALARHLQAEGIKPDMHEARTGSRYMSFEKGGVQWEVRSSDHTKPEYYGEAQKPVELTYYKDKQGEENLSVSVDLGISGYNVESMKALLAEIDRLKNDAGEVKESFDKGVVSDEATKRYPLLSQALGVKSENEVRAKEEAREHAEEARKQEMRSAVEDMVGKLHLNNVGIVDKPAGRGAGRRERAKGMFERSTGRITINIGNCADKRDAVVTLLHEAVAHHGLRKLFGENFETFLDNVYNSANAEIRRIIDKHSHRYDGDKRTATEEYMASLAERTDFENAKKSGWWQRIKDFFLKMLEKIGLKGFKGEDLSDNELRYVLWRSYENLKSGGKDTVFSAADDLAKQSELKVGEFAPGAKKTAPEENAEEVNERFNNELGGLTADNADNVVLSLGRPSKVLLSAGVENKPMKLYGNKVIKKMRKHGFALEELRNLPRAVADPIAVFNNYGENDNRSILTELKTLRGNFLVSVNIGKGTDVDFNIVSSVFGKGSGNVADWINKGYMTYVDKEKALNYLHHSALRAVTSDSSRLSSEDPAVLSHQSAPIAATVANAEFSSAAKVVENFENPKPESKNDILFRDGDAKDYEKAQARETYERRVSTGMFQSREAIQDSMLSLKVAMDAIEEATAGKAKRIEDYDGFENAYLGENRLSSVNQAESAAFAHLLIRPMMEEVNRLAPTAEDRAELIDYMFAKHGLERNAYMRQQAAEKKLAEYKKQNPGTAKTAADFIDAERDYAGLTTLTGESDVSAAEAEAQRMVADYENDYTFHGTRNEIYVCRKKIC